jgi:hypothetical protein
MTTALSQQEIWNRIFDPDNNRINVAGGYDDAQAIAAVEGEATLALSGIVDVTNTTDSSDATGDTGALRTEGGASIAKKLYVGTDLDVDGTAELDNITIGGAQGSDGQVLTSTGSGVGWEAVSTGSHAFDSHTGTVDSSDITSGAVDLAHMSVNSVDSDQYVDGSVDLVHLSANSVDSDQYVDGSIDTAHIAASQITNALMADDAIDSAEIADGAIDLVHMSADSVDSAQYVDGSIDVAHMSADSVDSSQYVDGSIDEAHIANDAVNFATHLKAGTDGELITWDASGDPAAVAVGTSGHVLTSGGTGVAPTFQVAAGGGVLTHAGSTTGEATTTSTSEVDLLTVGSLSIAVGTPVTVLGLYRKTAGASAGVHVGVKLNSTVVLTAPNMSSATNQAENYPFEAQFLYGVANYLEGGYMVRPNDAGAGGHSFVPWTANMPTATLTDVIIRGKTANASVTLGAAHMHVYAFGV